MSPASTPDCSTPLWLRKYLSITELKSKRCFVGVGYVSYFLYEPGVYLAEFAYSLVAVSLFYCIDYVV